MRVIPHLFETRFFYLAAAGLAVLLVRMARILHARGSEERLEAIMAERSRVAQELHDTLLQSISGTAMEIQGAITLLDHGSIELGRCQLSAALDHLGISMVEARQAIWNLRSPDSIGMPVTQALESAARRLCNPGPELLFSTSGSSAELDRTLRQNLYRIGIEAVTNAVRHSGCDEISISLDFAEQNVVLIVRDDGSGFDSASAELASSSNHWGLAGMRRRAQQCSGRLEINTAPGKGATVYFEAPLST